MAPQPTKRVFKVPRNLRLDLKFAPLVKKYGTPDLGSYYRTPGIFQALLRSIIFQQLSGKAAATIHGRFRNLFPRRHPTPELVLQAAEEKLRGAGLSRGKVVYVKDLAQKFNDGSTPFRRFAKISSEKIMGHLIAVKGIGAWTVHMFLMFTLHRPDILPTGDLVIRKGFQKLYELKKTPTHEEMEKLAVPWREHASYAAWYLWRFMDDKKK